MNSIDDMTSSTALDSFADADEDDQPFVTSTTNSTTPPNPTLDAPAIPKPTTGFHSSRSQGGSCSSPTEKGEGPKFDDAHTKETMARPPQTSSVLEVVSKGSPRDHQTDDEGSVKCRQCRSVFTPWRRKHHCRICEQTFCFRCASKMIAGSRFGHDGMLPVCDPCYETLALIDEDDTDDQDDGQSVMSSVTMAVSAERLDLNPPVHSQTLLRPPFAMHSFGQTDHPFNPDSTTEIKGPVSSLDSDSEIGTPSSRSRVSLGDNVDNGERGWRTRRESTAYTAELNSISLFHLKVMLRQMLRREQISNVKEWEETLLKLILRIARELVYTTPPHRQGEDMDVRKYVKIKKVPGGSPRDSEYVTGAVITKNLAHKQMSRSIRNPRVMLVTFPLEFNRGDRLYIQFGPVLRQEKEYISNLASRIAALRPHIVLAEQPMSGLVVNALAQHSIAVARTVKPSAIQMIAHMTQGDVFSSIDKLVLEPRLGHCARLRVQTFDHPLIPGRRKTYMRFEGCNPDNGCTIVLRGADTDTLRRIKKVMRFLAFIVRNLKLETYLWKDSILALPPINPNAIPMPISAVSRLTTSKIDPEGNDPPLEEHEQQLLSKRIDQSLEQYTKTFISVSATLRFPPPYPITRMKELDDELMHAKRTWENELVRREEDSHVVQSQETAVTAAIPLSNPSSYTLASTVIVSPTKPDTHPEPLKIAADIAVESHFRLTKWKHGEQRQIWEWYLRKNRDDFIVEKYQSISLLEYTIPTPEFAEEQACFPPQLSYIAFYGENDCTLGQFVERSIIATLVQLLDPKAFCTGKRCDKPLARHCKIYVHNETRLVVAVEQWDWQIVGPRNHSPSPDLVTTWSVCRVCGSVTPFIPVSEEMQEYSFAKFLELYFYPADVKLVRGAGCEHNIYQHHIRYFASKGMTVRFHADPVSIYELVYPPLRIEIRPETQLELKNAEYERLRRRNLMWYSALVDDLKLISIDAATGDEETDARLLSDINVLIARAEAEREDTSKLINKVYRESPPTDPLALNVVHSYRRDKIILWQHEFDRLPKPRPVALDRNGKRSSAFGSVRTMWPGRYEMSAAFDHPHLSSLAESEGGENPPKTRTTIKDSFISSASEASDSTIDKENESRVGFKDVSVRQLPRLPQRAVPQPTVAELVKKYQDFLPPRGVRDLTTTALASHALSSESEGEHVSIPRRSLIRNNRRALLSPERAPVSDPEHGYAANIAPRYLAHLRREQPHTGSRAVSPAGGSAFQSQESGSQGVSAVQRSWSDGGKNVKVRAYPLSPAKARQASTTGEPEKRKISAQTKEKLPARPLSNRTTKSTLRRAPTSHGTKVQNLTGQFERLNTERPNRRYAVIRGRRARPVASARARVEILDSIKDVIREESESSDSSSSEADDEDEGVEVEIFDPVPTYPKTATKTAFPAPSSSGTATQDQGPQPPPLDPVPLSPSPFLTPTQTDKNPSSTLTSDADLPSERTSILKALSGFWLQQPPISRHALEEDPMGDPEHIFRDSSMVVRTDEPTSIIALALNSPQYREMLAESRAEKQYPKEAKLDKGGVFMPDDWSVAESTSTWGVTNVASPELADPREDLRAPPPKLPWAITFESGGLTISCTVLYPEQFDALRRIYGCDKNMIESLSRCARWNASGEKPGSAFFKTRDDRFIAKELSRPELHTMETFVPAYFDYMTSAVSSNRPTLLAKHFGWFQVTFKKMGKEKGSENSKPTQMNLLVMENLFHDRRFSKKYDLKGSTRNRHVQSTGQEDEVLLDENLVQVAHLDPFYLREHSKRILRSALYNDSKFLADMNIMDYSLVVGVDSQNKELVVGIVHYIHTYTWDKKLESWVKGFVLAGRGEPTIVSPKQYRQRFISAMEIYFPLIPDRWMKIKDIPEDDSGSLLDPWQDW